jgi:hypothetical protein
MVKRVTKWDVHGRFSAVPFINGKRDHRAVIRVENLEEFVAAAAKAGIPVVVTGKLAQIALKGSAKVDPEPQDGPLYEALPKGYRVHLKTKHKDFASVQAAQAYADRYKGKVTPLLV